MPKVLTGGALRAERRRMGLPQSTLAALCGKQVSAICAAELRPGLLRDDFRAKVEEALDRVERMRLHFLPLRIDLSDASGLTDALLAFESGDLARAKERVAPERADRELPVQAQVITF